MGIDKQSNIAADLQIGPTSLGMVRIYIAAESIDLPLDFDPDEAEEIAEELIAAATAARVMAAAPKGKSADPEIAPCRPCRAPRERPARSRAPARKGRPLETARQDFRRKDRSRA